ncbi:MAG: hypothetical protein LBS55_01005 [Prevotellaceae bacterium]|nr:hypothetical protein [Prevotellaceae bacterium]
MRSFGGSIEETRKALDYSRDEVKKNGFPGLRIQWNGGTGFMLENEAKQFSERVKALGYNSVTFYNMCGIDEDYLVLRYRTGNDRTAYRRTIEEFCCFVTLVRLANRQL